MAGDTTFVFDSMVRGYHVFKDIWHSQIDERLPCERERHNVHDPFAISVKKGHNIVGHLPHRISAACYVFLESQDLVSPVSSLEIVDT